MSAAPSYVGTVKSAKIDTLGYYVKGARLGTGDLVNTAGYVTAADAPNADWAQTSPTVATYIKNKPVLAAVATSGSASDITTGTLPVAQMPYISANLVTDGVLSLARLPVIPAGYVSGLAPIATEGDLWTGNNTAVLASGYSFPLGPGGLTAWNRDGASGMTSFANNRGVKSPGGWEWVGYKADGSQENVGATLTTAGVLNVSGGLSVAGKPLAAVALSGSASDITTGTLPASVLPPTNKGSVSTGAYSSALNPDTTNAYLIGSASYQWKAVYAQAVYQNGQPLAAVAVSGSATDLTTGTLAVTQLPPIPATQIGSGSFGIGSFGTTVAPTASSTFDLGTAALAWRNAVFTGSVTVGGKAIQPVALSGSASDLTTGTLPLAQLPAIPAGSITSGSFTVGSFSTPLVPARTGLSTGSATSPWSSAFFTNGTFGGVLTGGQRTDRCQLGLCGSNLVPSSTSYFGLGIGTASGGSAAQALEYHVDTSGSDHVWYANATELFRMTGGGNSTASMLPGANGGQTLGAFNKQWLNVFAQGFFMNGLPLQQVCVTASASDIQQGTLPLAQVPALPPSRMSIQSGFSIDLVPASASTGNVGSSTTPWGAVWATQIYRNGTPLAAVATSGNLADLNQPFSAGNQQPYAITQPGSYLYYSRVSGSGRTAFATQRGTGTAGGFEFLTYNASNAVESVNGGPLLTLDNVGNASVAGGVKALGYGGLLVRAFDETAAYSAGANTFRFQGRPLDSLLAPSASWPSGSYAFGAAAQAAQMSVRVSGYVKAPLNDTYTFQITYKDGCRVWFNNLKVVDSWALQSGTATATATFTAQMGTGAVPFMIESFVGTGPGTLTVQWKGAANNTAYRTLTHGTGSAAMGLWYDMYENPTSQMGTLWCNGPVFAPSINNNGGGVSIADKVDMAGNPLTGVSFLSNNGSAMTVNAPLNMFSNTATNFSSIGVGTTTAAAPVDVVGKSAGLGQLHLTASDLADASIGFGGTQSSFGPGSAWVMGRGCYNAGSGFALGQQGPGGVLYVQGGSSPAVGINQANIGSGYSLDVLGSAHVSGTLYCNQIVAQQVTSSSTSSQTSIANTLYVVQGTGVGINTQSPAAALDVVGSGKFSGGLAAGTLTTATINAGSSALAIGSTVYVASGSTPLLGVNQPSPQSTLDVNGTANVTGTAAVGALQTASVFAPSSGSLTLGRGPSGGAIYVVGNNVGLFKSSPQATLDVAGSANVSNALSAQELDAPSINSSGQALALGGFVTMAGNKVGVLQTSPQSTLDVSGTFRATTSVTTGVVEATAINASKNALTVGATLYLTAGNTPCLGVFNSSPAAALDLTGTMRVSGAATMTGGIVTPSINASNQALAIGSNLYVSSGGVGVFQSSPQFSLDVSGTGRFTAAVTMAEAVTPLMNSGKQALTIGTSIYVTGGTSPMVGIMTPSPGVALDVTGTVRASTNVTAPALVGNTLNPTSASGSVVLNSALFVTSSGVGIYASSPGATLDVNGTGRFSSSLTTPSVTAQNINPGGGTVQLASTLFVTNNRLGVNQSAPAATLDVSGTGNFTGALTAASVNATSVGTTSSTSTVSGVITVVQASSSNNGAAVGILQSNPQYTLDVAGNARFSQNAVITGGIKAPSLANGGAGVSIPETVTVSGLVTPTINAGAQNLQIGAGITVLTPQNASAPFVGICNTSPTTQLDVTGSAKVSGVATLGGAVVPQINAGDQTLLVGTGITVASRMLGIGKSPASPLDVAGAACVSGLATLSGGIVTPVINGGSQALNVGNAITITGGGSPLVGILNGSPKNALDVTGNAAVSGSITTNTIVASQVGLGNAPLTIGSLLYLPGGSSPMLGVGQSSPAYTVDVAGNGRFSQGLTTPALQLGNEALSVGSAIFTTKGASPSVGICNSKPQSTLDVTGNLNVSQGAVLGGLTTPTVNAGNQALQVGSAIWVTSGSAPRVGVCQPVPTVALDVGGSINAATSVITPVINGGGQNLDLVSSTMSFRNSRVGLFTTSPGAILDVQGGGTINAASSLTAPDVYCSTINKGSTAVTIAGGVYVSNPGVPKVGINVSSPSSMLHVSSDIRSASLYTGTVNSDGASLSAVGGVLSLSTSAATLAVPTTVAVPYNNALNLQGAAGQGQQVFMSYGSSVGTNTCGYLNWYNAGGTASNPINTVGIGLYGQPGNALCLTAACTGVQVSVSPTYTLQVGNPGDTNRTAYIGGTLTTTGGITATTSLRTSALYCSSIDNDSSSVTISAGVYISNPGSVKVGVGVPSPSSQLHVASDIRSSSLYTGSVNQDGSSLSLVASSAVISTSGASVYVPASVSLATNSANGVLALSNAAAQGQLTYMTIGNATSTNNCAYINWQNAGGSGSGNNSVSLGMWGETGNAITATASGVSICSTGTAAYTLQVGNVGDTGNSAYVGGTLYTTGMLQATGGVQAPSLASPGANLNLFCGSGNTGSLAVGTPSSNRTSLQWNLSGVTVVGTLTASTISNGGAGVSITETTTVPKLALPQASSFTGKVAELSDQYVQLVVAGSITMWAGPASVPPTGYLFCDGSSKNRSDYPNLYAIIGTTYGPGTSSSTFQVPDLRSSVPGGFNGGDGGFNTMGKNAGGNTTQLSTANMPSHNHGVNDGGHSHGSILGGTGYPQGALFSGAIGGSDAYRLKDNLGKAGNSTQLVTSKDTTGISIQNAGSNQAFSIVQSTVVLQFIIKY